MYTLTRTHTNTHIYPPISSITPDEKAAEPSSGSKGRGGRQGRGVGRAAGYPRATLASKKSRPSSDKDNGRPGKGRTQTSASARATGDMTEEHSGRSLLTHLNPLFISLFAVIRLHDCSHCFWTSDFSVKKSGYEENYHSCFFDTMPFCLYNYVWQ